MLTKDVIKEKLADLENRYCSFMMEHFACWEQWAEQSDRLLAGKEVPEDEVPEPFRFEYRMTKVVMEMDATGAWDWNNPKLRKVFEEAAGNPLYRLMAETITESAIRLCAEAGVKTLIEVGAGKGHLTSVMAAKLAEKDSSIRLIVTDTDTLILQNIDRIKNDYPGLNLDTLQWDINQAPAQALIDKIQPPCLVYERASIMYTTIPAIKNIARLADIVVFGDMFNYTGALYGYDEIFKKLGVYPLFYREVKPLLDECFREHFFLDSRAQKAIGLPNTSILIALK
ncbi:MAG: hypothetical protein NTX06_04330 [Proteobacteria bacterium]|nr:hypothetical protein [Pseudomonadota bacterium]